VQDVDVSEDSDADLDSEQDDSEEDSDADLDSEQDDSEEDNSEDSDADLDSEQDDSEQDDSEQDDSEEEASSEELLSSLSLSVSVSNMVVVSLCFIREMRSIKTLPDAGTLLGRLQLLEQLYGGPARGRCWTHTVDVHVQHGCQGLEWQERSLRLGIISESYGPLHCFFQCGVFPLVFSYLQYPSSELSE
jgi:hypothetical protein